MSLIGNALKPLAKSVLIPLGLRAVAAATDSAIRKIMSESVNTTLIISMEEMNDTMETLKSLEESALLIKDVTEKTKNGGFLKCYLPLYKMLVY